MEFSPQQDAAIKAVQAWLKDPSGQQIFRLFGYAGTGKTTLARELAAEVKGSVLYATFTGKAALVLRSKGCDGASTIHSLIYKCEQDPTTGERTFVLNDESALHQAALLIIDEVSMVGEDLAKDLLSFDKRILVLGDPAQLPPIDSEGYFIAAEPDVMLDEVHRQAADNPIIRMSMDIRAGRWLEPGTYGESLVLKRGPANRDRISELVMQADQVICGMNKTRTGMNARIRQLKGIGIEGKPYDPVVGDKLICLRNVHQEGLLNGSMWNLAEVELQQNGKSARGNDRIPTWEMAIDSLDEDRERQSVSVFPHFFRGTERDLHWKVRRESHEFTFGWAITCHKSQGSQWSRPLVVNEAGVFREHRRNWLYTAITRAEHSITVVL